MFSSTDFRVAVQWLCQVQPQFWSWNDVKPTLLPPFDAVGYAVSSSNVIMAPNSDVLRTREMTIETSSDIYQIELGSPSAGQLVPIAATSCPSNHCNTYYIQLEYHIVFNSTYLAPQLLFSAARLDGTPLSLEELLPQLSASCSVSQHALDLSFDWSFVTQVVLLHFIVIGRWASCFLGAPFLANTVLHHPPLQNKEFNVVGIIELRRSSSERVSGNVGALFGFLVEFVRTTCASTFAIGVVARTKRVFTWK